MTKSKKEKLFTQVSITTPITAEMDGVEKQIEAQMTTWVDASPKLKKGTIISLKDDPRPDRKWTIVQVYDTRNGDEIDTYGWDNNDYSKHEGLGL